MQPSDFADTGNGRTGSQAVQAEPTNDLRNFFDTVLNRTWLISLCVVLGLVGAAFYYKTAPRSYKATNTVQVEQEEKRVVKIEEIVKEDLRAQELMNTIVQKLRSQPLLERVLVTNGLMDGHKLLGPKMHGPISKEKLLAKFGDMLKTSLRRNTRLIDVTVSHGDPELAARLANSVVEQYMLQDSEAHSSSTKGVFDFLEMESGRLKKKLEVSEQALQEYREKVGSVSMVRSEDIIMPQIRELGLRLSQAKNDTIRLKAAYNQVENAHSNINEMVIAPQIAIDASVAETRTVVLKLENDFAILRQRYKEKHPKYIQAINQLEAARNELTNCVLRAAESLRVAYENAVKTEKGLEASMHESEDSALKLSQQSIRYNILAREVESDRALFDSVLNRMKETSITKAIEPEKIRVVEPASVPEVPASPKLKLVFGVALMGSLMLGCVLAFGLAALDTSLKSVDDAEQYLRLPVLSSIPKFKEVKKGTRPLIAAEDSRSQGAEAFRTLRTSLTMLGREEDRRTFLFTSALPQEGKSFSSLNFSACLAQQGLRTILIDADLRRPSIAKYLAADSRDDLLGVSDYLLGRKTLAEIMRPESSIPGFYWIPAGTSAPNPAELIAQGKFPELIAEALLQFDRVVIDSAPVHAVSDTLLLADKVQTTVMVLHGGRTPRKFAARCLHLLQNSGAAVGGIVLNMLPRLRGHGYGYYGSYYGSYQYYGRDGEQKRSRKKSEKASNGETETVRKES